MTSARALRARAWKVGTTAALTFVASGLLTVGTASSASAEFCEDAGVTTSAGTVGTPTICGVSSFPYTCVDPRAGLDPTVVVYADVCVFD